MQVGVVKHVTRVGVVGQFVWPAQWVGSFSHVTRVVMSS